MRNKVKNCKTPPSLPTSSQVQLHSFTPDSSTSSSGNGGQSVTAVVGSAVPAPCFSLGPLHGLRSFWINPVWVFHRLRFLLGNACVLVWIPPGASRNLRSGTRSLSSPSCFQLGVHMAAAHFFPPHPLPVQKNIFCPISNPLSQRCPCLAAGLSHALWCVGCIQHKAALASPHSGSCSPRSQHLDNYTQCADLEKLLLKMTEKGLGILRACNCLSRRKNLCSPITSTVAAPLTPRWLISFACPPDWVT